MVNDPPRLISEPPKYSLMPFPTKLSGTADQTRKPSIFPGWLGFLNPNGEATKGPLGTSISSSIDSNALSSGNGQPLLCGIRFDISTDVAVAPIVGLDVRTAFGFGTISRIFRDEDYPDEAGFCHPPVFIILVMLSSSSDGNHAMAFLSPDSIWTRNIFRTGHGLGKDGDLDSNKTVSIPSMEVSSSSSSSASDPSSVVANNSHLLESIVEDDEDTRDSSPTTASTSVVPQKAWREQLYTQQLSTYQFFL